VILTEESLSANAICVHFLLSFQVLLFDRLGSLVAVFLDNLYYFFRLIGAYVIQELFAYRIKQCIGDVEIWSAIESSVVLEDAFQPYASSDIAPIPRKYVFRRTLDEFVYEQVCQGGIEFPFLVGDCSDKKRADMRLRLEKVNFQGLQYRRERKGAGCGAFLGISGKLKHVYKKNYMAFFWDGIASILKVSLPTGTNRICVDHNGMIIGKFWPFSRMEIALSTAAR
jgi:hypothetical protein